MGHYWFEFVTSSSWEMKIRDENLSNNNEIKHFLVLVNNFSLKEAEIKDLLDF